jgi:hypothetical protein
MVPNVNAVFCRSKTLIIGSNPTRGMNVCVCVFCVLSVVGKDLGPPSEVSYHTCKIPNPPPPQTGGLGPHWSAVLYKETYNSQNKEVISLNSINRLVFVMEMQSEVD